MKREKRWMALNYDLQIPRELRRDNYKGHLTAEETLFLAEMEGLVQHGNSPHGCYLSNRQLAENEGVSVARIKQILRTLMERGYIKVCKVDGVRYIRTCYSGAVTKAIQRRTQKTRKPGNDQG